MEDTHRFNPNTLILYAIEQLSVAFLFFIIRYDKMQLHTARSRPSNAFSTLAVYKTGIQT